MIWPLQAGHAKDAFTLWSGAFGERLCCGGERLCLCCNKFRWQELEQWPSSQVHSDWAAQQWYVGSYHCTPTHRDRGLSTCVRPLLHLLSRSHPPASQCGCFKSNACFGTVQDLQCPKCPKTRWHGLKQTQTEPDCPCAASTCTRPAAQYHSNRTGDTPNTTLRCLSQYDTL